MREFVAVIVSFLIIPVLSKKKNTYWYRHLRLRCPYSAFGGTGNIGIAESHQLIPL